ncbi:MAG: ABC transporter ATP-binding protein [Gracilibacteraceae bacterium]|nr:ABC transporter ATP-binding protein [Gracilibacteraceae bacterium]
MTPEEFRQFRRREDGSRIIEAQDVSVKYIMGDFKEMGLKEYLIKRVKGDMIFKELWALRDVSFHVERGDLLGIIGSNGSGKSTILKVLAGIMPPTKGDIRVNGRVAPLLELAAGFDEEMTIRENVFLRGALLGYSRDFVAERYDGIIDFSELKEYEDVAFRKLSSGMKSKLAFSLASFVTPDVLILDEVLSVGDIAFQKKSEARMQELMSHGVTTILVSHSLSQIREMCTKVLWIEKGEMRGIGATEEICAAYEEYMRT